MFKSHKYMCFFDSPEPACLRNFPVLEDRVHGLRGGIFKEISPVITILTRG